MCRDASALPCILLGDGRETDPLACLQLLIAIIPQWKQSIHSNTSTPAPNLFLTSTLSVSCFLAHSFFSQPLSTYVAQRCHIGCGVMWLVGGRDEVVLTNVLLKKDDLLWLRVPDWSCGVLFIHLCPPAAAAAFTSSCLPLPSPLFPSCPGLSCCLAAGSWPSVAAVIGSAGLEKEANAPSLPRWVLEERGKWLKTDIPCCFILCVTGVGPSEGLQDQTLALELETLIKIPNLQNRNKSP